MNILWGKKWPPATRTSHPEAFWQNFAKFTRKHLCQSLFVNKYAGLSLNLRWLLLSCKWLLRLQWLLRRASRRGVQRVWPQKSVLKKESTKALFKKHNQNLFWTSVSILFAGVIISQFSKILHEFWRLFLWQEAIEKI